MSKSGGSSLNSLLNYRFVKKIKPKLQHEGSNSSQDSDDTKCPSDNSSSQSLSDVTGDPQINGQLNGPSARSGQPKDGSNTDDLDDTEKYWDGDDEMDTQVSASVNDSHLETSPIRMGKNNEPTTVPETPASLISIPISPTSPVFRPKSSSIRKPIIDESEDIPESSSSSPWFSKEKGKAINGFSSKQKRKKTLPDFSDDDSEEEDKSTKLTPEDNEKLNNLMMIFPSQPRHLVEEVFLESDKNFDMALESLVDRGKNATKKKKRVQRMESSDSDMSPGPPLKRARPLLSSDNQEEEMDSQATVENLGSQEGVISLSIQEERLKFLSETFPNKSRKKIYKALEDTDWVVSEAVEVLTNDPESEERKAIDLSDDDEEEFADENEAGDSEDSFDDSDEHKTQKQIILSFFEEASVDELAGTPGCSRKKAELIVQQRPFESYENLVYKFTATKGLTADVISGCREIIRVRDVVVRLMEKCEKISLEMERVVTYLTRRDTIDEVDDRIQITKQPELLNQEFKLKPFQMVGLNWLRIMHTKEINGILADEMGLGKTIQTIAFLAHLLEEGEEGPHVVIVPSSTIDNWLREFSVWCPAIKVLVYYGSQEDRRVTRRSILYEDFVDFHVVLTTYNMATGSNEDRALFKKFEFHYAIFDEGHMLKNMSSLRYQNLMKIMAERRLLLTGTPLQNNLLELMSLLCFVMPEIFIGKTDQLKRIFSMITKSTEDKKSKYEAERIAHAKRIMKPFVLRRLKSEVQKQLPKKIDHVERCQMIPTQEENYHNLVSKFKKELRQEEKGNKESRGGASMLMQLRKAANHPLLLRVHYTDKKLREMAKHIAREPSHRDRNANKELIYEDMCVMHDFEIHKLCEFYKKYIGKYKLDPSVIADSGKFRVLDDLLVNFKSKGDRVLIFSQFTMMMDIMEEYLKQKKYKYLRLDGQTPVPDRIEMIDKYSNNPDIFIFLLSTRAGGLGINLTAANVVILHDIDFNPYNDKQAEDRCHRVGQTREVSIVKLISKDTMEEAMLRCAQEKLHLEKQITTNEESEESGGDVASLLREALGQGKV